MRRDLARLVDIVRACEGVARALGGMTLADFEGDEDVQDIILWRLTKAGEAAYHLSDDVRSRYPSVVWHDAVGFRNRVVHGYSDIDLRIVYETATEDAPRLLDGVRDVITAEFPDSDEG